MLWESSHTGISLEQATNPEISTTLVPRAHYAFCTPKSRSPSLPLRIPARMQGLQQPGLPCVLRERGRGRGDGERGSEEVTAGWLVLAPTCDTDLVPQALLLQLFGASNPQHMISHAWKCLKLQTLSQHFLNEARARPPGQQ